MGTTTGGGRRFAWSIFAADPMITHVCRFQFNDQKLDGILRNVISANPAIHFDYIGLFQENVLGDRWMGEKTQPSHILLNERRHDLSHATNLDVRMLGIWNVDRNPIPKNFSGRLSTFQNDIHQLENLRRATTFISDKSAYVLRVREDVGWYAPFLLPEAPVKITFKNCKSWGGVNDKMWYGPREAVLALHTAYWDAFMHKRLHNTEEALEVATRKLRTTQTQIRASDARMRANCTLCWKRFYACETDMPLEYC